MKAWFKEGLSGLLVLLLMILGSKTRLHLVGVPVVFTDLLVIAWSIYKPFPASALPAAVFLLMGTAGLPVFASGLTGAEAWSGNTSGYLAGYLIIGILPAVFQPVLHQSLKSKILLAVMLFLVLHASGMTLYLYNTRSSLSDFIQNVFLPFAPIGLAKAILAAVMVHFLEGKKQGEG